MTAIPQPQHSIAALIDQRHEARVEPPRGHLGASVLGHPCDRWLWLSFRWAVIEKHSGRMLRLFARGQREEQQVISDLRAIGVDVRSSQQRIELAPHVGGSMDGICESGVPGAPKTRHVLEIKTHNKKSFDQLEKDGVEKSKPQHWAQMQCYMLGSGIERALYVAVCKDDDRYYTERVAFEADAAAKFAARGRRIALAERMPEPLSADPSWWQCKMCAAHDLCHGSRMTREVNCRTCAHATPTESGTWRCERHDADDIPLDWQRKGCESHVLHPDLVPWHMTDPLDQWTAVYIIDDVPVANGEPDAHVFASRELIANPSACAKNDETLQSLRNTFDGRVVV